MPNPSFETYTHCPGSTDDLSCVNWQGVTSPDYFNACGDSSVNVPRNFVGYQYARTGNAYVGIVTKYNNAIYREYVQSHLLSALSGGTSYYVSMYVCLADSDRADGWLVLPSDRIGIYLSNGLPYSGNPCIAEIPQIENPSGNLLSDTLNWVQISGWYTALGGENWITIGNFRDDASTTGNGFSYYYIDDVYIGTDSTEATSISQVKKQTEEIKIYPSPAVTVIQVTVNGEQAQELKILDILGKDMSYEMLDMSSNTTELDVSSLPNGIYFLTAKTNESSYTKKFVVQH